MLDPVSPQTYAKHLAGYISDPSTIRVRVMEHFGRAPSLKDCAAYRAEAVRPKWTRVAAKDFACGHSRDLDNVIYTDTGTERCATCRAAYQARQHIKRIKLRKPPDNPAIIVPTRSPFPADIVKDVAQAFGLPVVEMVSPNRTGHYTRARMVAARLMRDRNYSLPRIARCLGRTDHSTALNMLQRYEPLAQHYPEMRKVYEALK